MPKQTFTANVDIDFELECRCCGHALSWEWHQRGGRWVLFVPSCYTCKQKVEAEVRADVELHWKTILATPGGA